MASVHDRWQLVEPLLVAHAFRDPAAFGRGAIAVRPCDNLREIGRQRLVEESAIARAFRLFDPEMLRSLGEEHGPERPLHAILGDAAERWLVADGDHWSLTVQPGNPGHEVIRWRGLTMLLPPSIITSAAIARTSRGGPRRVQLLPDTMVPEGEVAHLHTHLGPMLPFEALWGQLRYAFLQNGTLESRNGKQIASVSGEDLPKIGLHQTARLPGARWLWLLELAFAARVWLAQRIARAAEDSPPPHALRDLARGRVRHEERPRALLQLWSTDDGDGQTWRKWAAREARALARARAELLRREVRARATGRPPPLPSAWTEADEEVDFVADALRTWRDDLASPTFFAMLLCQYLRIKTALYRQLVVDPWSEGLRHFLNVVQRDSPYCDAVGDKPHLERLRLAAAFDEAPLRVAAVEIHIPPPTWLKRGPESHERHSWILSFVRSSKPGDLRKQSARAWSRVAAEVGATCRLLERCIERRPSLLRTVRGLSLMDWERNGPVWLFERAFRRLRDRSAGVAAAHSTLGVKPLRMAMHLGEDFDHLLTGLRNVFEPFEWGLIQRGDRLGHALALGLRPAEWCADYAWVRVRPLDRILDLGFAYWAFEHLEVALTADDIERMRVEAATAVRALFGTNHRPHLEFARDLWLALPHPWHVQSDGPVAEDPLVTARRERGRILEDRHVGRAALGHTLSVETARDLRLIEAIHAAVLRRVAEWQVAVEVNPSSNLLVGGFRSIFHQPTFHSDDLPIVLNADDPLTFGTTLADEYAYAWAGMVAGSRLSPNQARRRLEEAARCSMRYRFGAQAQEAEPSTQRERRRPVS